MSGETLTVLAVVAGLVGSGWVLKLLRGALSDYFPSKSSVVRAHEEIETLNRNVSALTSLYERQQEAVERLERDHARAREDWWGRIAAEVVGPLATVADKMEALGMKLGDISERQARHEERMVAAAERIARLEAR